MLSMLKMPLLMNIDELVPHLDGFVDFGSTPRSREHPFFICVGVYVISLSPMGFTDSSCKQERQRGKASLKAEPIFCR